MMIDAHWYIDRHDRFLADVTPLVTLCVEGDATGYEWSVNAHGDGRGAGDWSNMASGEAPGIASAKLAAETAWREWTKAQAQAANWYVAEHATFSVGDGPQMSVKSIRAVEWTSAIPKEDGWYWVRTGTDDAPDQWPARVEFLTATASAAYWGEQFQCWPVPISLPPEPVASFVIPDGWISVEDGLPDTDGPWLVAFTVLGSKMQYHEIAYFDDEKGWTDSDYRTVPVTHWRPLPPLPEGR